MFREGICASRRSNNGTSSLLDPDQLADYEQLRRLVSRETSLTLLDDFAKWLFPTAAIVGTLGASFGVSDANSLTGTGKTLFAVAVASVAVSLALAALARLPLPKRVYLYSRQSMASDIDRVVVVRGGRSDRRGPAGGDGERRAEGQPLNGDGRDPDRDGEDGGERRQA
jgi:hypothetical protein